MISIEWEIPYFIGSIYEDKRLLISFETANILPCEQILKDWLQS